MSSASDESHPVGWLIPSLPEPQEQRSAPSGVDGVEFLPGRSLEEIPMEAGRHRIAIGWGVTAFADFGETRENHGLTVG